MQLTRTSSFAPFRAPSPTPGPGGPGAARGPEPDGGPPDGPELTLGAFIPAARRRWPYVVVLAAVGAALGFWSGRSAEPRYRAVATIRITDVRQAVAGSFDAGRERPDPEVNPLLSKLQVLRSRSLAARVVETEPAAARLRVRTTGLPRDLVDSVRVAPGVDSAALSLQLDAGGVTALSRGESTAVGRAPFGTPLEVGGVRFAVRRPVAATAGTLRIVPPASAAGWVQGRLNGKPREDTDVVDVSFEAPDPALAQKLVNAAVTTYRDMLMVASRDRGRQRVAFLEQQLARTEASLEVAQAELGRFRSAQQVYSTREDMTVAQAGYAATDTRRRELDAERRLVRGLLERRDRAATAEERADALRGLVAAMSGGAAADPTVSEQYRALVRLQSAHDSLTSGPIGRAYTHPDVVALDSQIAATRGRVLDAARARVTGIDARVGALDRLAASDAAALRRLPRLEQEEVRLTTRVANLSRIADQLRSEYQQARIADAAEGGAVEVIDFAGVASSVGTPLPRVVVFGAVLGLGCGLLLALGLEMRDQSFRRTADIQTRLRLPELAVIPRTAPVARARARLSLPSRAGRDHRAPVAPLANFSSTAADAYRMLRTNVLFATAGARRRVVAVTSPLPRDGKSTIAANLAVAMAVQYQRVLLIDTDVRRPVAHRVFGVSRGGGLVDYLAGARDLHELIKPTSMATLDILTAGQAPDGVLDVFHGDRLEQLLEAASASYEVVVVDVPPVLLTADAAVVAAHCDNTVLVVRAGQTAMDAGAQAVRQLDVVGARVCGVVLNDPDEKVDGYGAYGYGYGEYKVYAQS